MNVPPAAALLPLLFASLKIQADPLQIGGSKGPTQFADGTLITVYIPPDPKGLGRDANLSAGILSWNKERPLLNHGIQIQVKPGVAPAGAQNAVQVNWKAPTGGTELGEAMIKGTTGATNTTTGGSINIDPDPADVNSTAAKNLGIHEMGHILSLADLPHSGTAMDPDFTGAKPISITDEDTLELFSTFAASNGTSSASLHASVTPDGSFYRYDYTLTWLSGIDLALFQVDTNGAFLQSIMASAGWSVNPSNGSDVTLDFPGGRQQFISFVVTDGMSYLGPDNPNLEFSFETLRRPDTVAAFLSGTVDTIGPAAVPEPPALGMFVSGLLLMWMIRLRGRDDLTAPVDGSHRANETACRCRTIRA
jgi:hypothetical protein